MLRNRKLCFITYLFISLFIPYDTILREEKLMKNKARYKFRNIKELKIFNS